MALFKLWKKVRSERHRHYLLKDDLTHPCQSAWSTLYNQKRDESFVDVMGFDVKCFHELHELLFDNQVQTMGRPRALDTKGELALTLHWLNSTMRQKTLAQLFGVTPSSVSDILQNVITLIIEKLEFHPDCKIQWPSPEKMRALSDLVRARSAELPNVFGFVDGLWLPVPNDQDESIQNAFYNGWKTTPSISNVLCFSPEGKIIYAAYNMPGSWHDWTCARGLFHKLKSKTPAPFRILGDSAFSTTEREIKEKLLTPLRENEISIHPRIKAAQVRLHQVVVRERQAAEWGMRALQGTFARLTLLMSNVPKRRRELLLAVFLLHNFHASRGGLNQIREVYRGDFSYQNVWSDLKRVFKERTANRLRRYYRLNHQ